MEKAPHVVEDATAELPKAQVEEVGTEGLKIHIEKLRTEEYYDQTSLYASDGQGCISSPTGPSC